MKLTFAQVKVFVDDWRHLRLTDEDLRELELQLMTGPIMGRVMAGTGGLRKLRFSPSSWSRGKSGAVRVCYAYFPAVRTVYLIAAFAKNEKENLTTKDRSMYKSLLKEIDSLHRQSGGQDNV